MNLHGIGTDLVDNTRLGQAISRQGQAFLDRIFTRSEQEYCQSHADPLPHFAARFAAKEAVAKAFGTGIGAHAAFQEIEVIRTDAGAPGIRLHGAAAAYAASRQLGGIFLSLSHTATHSVAYVVIVSNGCEERHASSAVMPV